MAGRFSGTVRRGNGDPRRLALVSRRAYRPDMRAIALFSCLALISCAQWPDLPPSDTVSRAEWPRLLPLDSVLSMPPESAEPPEEAAARLSARAESLRARAAVLRAPVASPESFEELRARADLLRGPVEDEEAFEALRTRLAR